MSEQHNTKEILRARLGELRTLRDEIRLDLHLAGMDLRDEWKAIERKLPDPDRAAEQLEKGAKEAIETLATELQNFRARVRDRAKRT
jgi:hypothetical protein